MLFLKTSLGFTVVLFLFFAFTGQSFAEYRFSDGSKIEIQWYEKEGAILTDKVCFNYQDDSRKYRQCRKKAIDYFKEECRYYEDKIRNTPRKYRSLYEPELNKFCNASESYSP
jgi:hypothetical protein